MNRLDEIRNGNGFHTAKHGEKHGDTDIDYLLDIIEIADTALESVANGSARGTMRRYAEEALKAIRGN